MDFGEQTKGLGKQVFRKKLLYIYIRSYVYIYIHSNIVLVM